MIAELTWRVPGNGFHWKKCPGDHQHPAGVALVWVHDLPYREYDPAGDEPGLFRTFASISPTRDGIGEFANRFGTLGLAIDVLQLCEEWETIPKAKDVLESVTSWKRGLLAQWRYGDRLSDWQSEIRLMAEAVQAFDRARSKEAQENDAWVLEDAVNGGFHRAKVRPVLTKARKTSQLALQLEPDTLIGLMWVQLALAVSGGKEFRQCPSCQRWIEYSAERGRLNQRYCGEACRARAYRRRKDEVIELAGAGLPPKQVSERTGINLMSVKKWLKEAKPK